MAGKTTAAAKAAEPPADDPAPETPAAPPDPTTVEEPAVEDAPLVTAWRYTDPDPRDYLTFGRLKAGDVVYAAGQPDSRFEPADTAKEG